MHRYVYGALALLLAAAFAPALIENNRVMGETERLETVNVPLLGEKELDLEFDRTYKALIADEVLSPERLPELNALTKKTSLLYKRWRVANGRNNGAPWQKWDTMSNNWVMTAMPDRQRRYAEKFGWPAVQKAADDFNAAHPELSPLSVNVPSNAWRLFLGGYFESIGLALIFFAYRVQRAGRPAYLELWRIVPCALFWPVFVFLYPQRLDLRKAARQTLEFAVWANSLVYSVASFFGFGLIPSIAKAQAAVPVIKIAEKKDAKRKRGTFSFSTKTTSQFPSGLSGGSFSEHPNQETMLGVSFANGWHAYLMHNMGLNDADPSSDSGDWLTLGAGKTVRLGTRASVTAEGMYMNGKPLGSVPGGDYLVGHATVTRSFAVGKTTVSPFAKYLDIIALGKTPGRGMYGYAGANISRPARGAHMNARAHVIIDRGYFGKAPAAIAAFRWEVALPFFKDKRFALKPFVGTQGPVWKGQVPASDPRKWFVYGGLQLGFSSPF